MSKKQEIYHVGLSVYKQGRGNHHWAISHDNIAEGPIASGLEGTHKKAREAGIEALAGFCRKVKFDITNPH